MDGGLLVPWWRWCYRSLLLGRWHSLQPPPEKHEEAGLFYWNQNRAALHVAPLARRLSVGWVWLRYAWLVAGAPFASLCCDWSAGSVPTVDSSFFLLHGMKMSTNCPESTRDTSLERANNKEEEKYEKMIRATPEPTQDASLEGGLPACSVLRVPTIIRKRYSRKGTHL